MTSSPAPAGRPGGRLPGPLWDRRRGFVALAALAIGHFAVDAYSSGYAPLLPVLRDRLDLSLARVGWCTAVLSVSSSLLQPLYGLLSDRLGSRFILALAPAISGLGLGALAWTESYAAALAMFFVAGIGIAAYHPQGAAQATEAATRRPGLFMSLFLAGGTVGFAAGPLLMAEAVARWQWTGLWRVAALGVAVSLLLVLLVPDPRPGGRRRGGLRPALRRHRRPLLLLYLLVVIRGAVQLTFTGFLSLYWVGEGLTLTRASLYLTVLLACGSVGGIVGGWLMDHVPGRIILCLSMTGALPLMAGGMLLSGALQLLALSAGYAFLLLTMSVNVLMAQRWVPEHRSTVSSLMMGFAWGVGGTATPLVGMAGDVVGLGNALLGVALLPGVGILLAWMLPRTPPMMESGTVERSRR